jgi:CIC family chloride channel protein
VNRAAWAWLVASAAVVGAIAGLLASAFHNVLDEASELRDDLVDWADGTGVLRVLVVVVTIAAAVGASVWLVRRYAPRAAGSGIPDVERVLLHEAAAPRPLAIPVKFVSGTLSIGAGLTLGREGPTVQMGGVVGHLAAGLGRRMPDHDILMTAGAAAGLAAAFNAPLAGVLFVVEELLHRFSARLLAAALVASATSIAVLRAWLGSELDLPVPAFDPQPSWGLVAFAVLGLLAGLLGVAFNRVLLGTMDGIAHVRRIPPVAVATIVGAIIGLIAWEFPNIVGSGYPLAQEALTGDPTLGALAMILAARFALTIASYGIGAAGGLFAPLLVIGAELGRLVGDVSHEVAPGAVPVAAALTVAGMAAVLVGSVRAPLTAVVLILEMTGAFSLLLPTLVACAAAYVVPTAIGDAPIYDALRTRPRDAPLSFRGAHGP